MEKVKYMLSVQKSHSDLKHMVHLNGCLTSCINKNLVVIARKYDEAISPQERLLRSRKLEFVNDDIFKANILKKDIGFFYF